LLRPETSACASELDWYAAASSESVEAGPTASVFAEPAHAYTRELLDTIPRLSVAQSSAREP
jgi:ABC-type dipeptide/oligopeptide/nickel transport system ATPase component